MPHKHVSIAGLHKYFQPALLIKESMGISEAATKEANAAVEKALNEDRQPRKRKYQHITPDSVQKEEDILLYVNLMVMCKSILML